MAFGFAATAGAPGGAGSQAQSGPDLEEVQTEVIIKAVPCLLVITNGSFRLLDSFLSPATQKYDCYHRHGRQTLYRIPQHLSSALHPEGGSSRQPGRTRW